MLAPPTRCSAARRPSHSLGLGCPFVLREIEGRTDSRSPTRLSESGNPPPNPDNPFPLRRGRLGWGNYLPPGNPSHPPAVPIHITRSPWACRRPPTPKRHARPPPRRSAARRPSHSLGLGCPFVLREIEGRTDSRSPTRLSESGTPPPNPDNPFPFPRGRLGWGL